MWTTLFIWIIIIGLVLALGSAWWRIVSSVVDGFRKK